MERRMSTFTLQDLAARVKERAQASPDVSYTRKLIDRGYSLLDEELRELKVA